MRSFRDLSSLDRETRVLLHKSVCGSCTIQRRIDEYHSYVVDLHRFDLRFRFVGSPDSNSSTSAGESVRSRCLNPTIQYLLQRTRVHHARTAVQPYRLHMLPGTEVRLSWWIDQGRLHVHPTKRSDYLLLRIG